MKRAETHHTLLKKLKRQVILLRHREEQARNKLRTALRKAKGLSSSYKRKLARKARMTKNRVIAVQAATYKRIAADIGRQLEKKVVAKERALTTAIVKIEKLFADRLIRAMHIKAKKTAHKQTKPRSTARQPLVSRQRRGAKRHRRPPRRG